MSFRVRFAPAAAEDLVRLFDYLLERAETIEDLDRAEGVIGALRQAIYAQLAVTPFSFRKAGDGSRSTRRELIVPSGSTGYVALYEITGPRDVLVLAVRHQLEQDYH
ncbi:type II toxin-antitoxin system RelE/ParE family toxin [Aquincola sp. S2]|uniref:Type II toxin-antitoxin system RelE/ParE family toxin n=1 Tax=Pseudaquabacterium terrae TaxID=2732868 RepID=A0ABX2EQT0_9BURK|nr:type II toxin-antitoxin system RelE/ParE family toxin [Aquabacterium terrae]